MTSIEQMIATLAVDGLQINIWPCAAGFQANVKERGSNGWTCYTDEDPLYALAQALRLRSTGVATRPVVELPIEEKVADEAPPVDQYGFDDAADDDFEALL